MAHADGAGLPEDLVDRILGRIDGLPYEGKSSMLHDLERGRRLEVAWLSGTIARMGHDLSVATPTHAPMHAPTGPLHVVLVQGTPSP